MQHYWSDIDEQPTPLANLKIEMIPPGWPTVVSGDGDMAAHGRYRTSRDALIKDEAALLAVYEAHAVGHRCTEGECEARQVLDKALDRIRALLAKEDVAGGQPLTPLRPARFGA